MKDLSKEIPQRAFLNALILQQVQDDEFFQSIVARVAGEFDIPEYQVIGPSYVASLLYCLLVVPRELFIKDNEQTLDQLLPLESLLRYFIVHLDSENATRSSSHFLRRLRNSIAHARFSVDKQMNFMFRDQKANEKIPVFVVESRAHDLMSFLSEFGAFFANLRTTPLGIDEK